MEQNSQKTNYVGPFITMVFLFFIVGFLTNINQQLQKPLQATFLSEAGNLKNTFTTMIIFMFFLAFPLTGGIGSNWVNKFGYKGTLIRALIVMVFGLGIFFLSSWFTVKFPDAKANITSAVIPYGFFIFLLGSFVVGAAITILQVVINPYLTVCEVKGTQPVQRMQIGASGNSIGTTIGPFFVTAVIFGGVAIDKINVGQLMIPFLALMATVIVTTFVVTKLTLPDIQGSKADQGEKLEKSVWSFSHLTLGVIAIFFYVGVEVAVGANINLYAGGLELYKDYAALMATLYWLGMLIGRLVSSAMNNVSPKAQLIPTVIAAIILTSLAMAFRNPWFLVAIGLFHSVMWGAIFTMAVNRLGKYTSVASGAIMIGVLGGAILPFAQGVLADALHNDWTWTWLIVIAGEAYLLYYALLGSKVKTAEIA